MDRGAVPNFTMMMLSHRLAIKEFLSKYCINGLNHAPYASNEVPNAFRLFLNMKFISNGQKFSTGEIVKENALQDL